MNKIDSTYSMQDVITVLGEPQNGGTENSYLQYLVGEWSDEGELYFFFSDDGQMGSIELKAAQ